MTAVTQADNTVVQIRKKVRRLTASAGENTLSTADIDAAINTFYDSDFAYSIKLDQMRSVYTFFTSANIDRYPLDVNHIQGVRAPFYVEGIQGTFGKDRQQFFNTWPRFPTLFNPISGDGITTVYTNINSVPGPYLSKEFVLGGVDKNGLPISINDDGNGNLILLTPNPVVSVPAQNTNPAIPGMYNMNTASPGLNNPVKVGIVDYVTGIFSVTFPVAPAAGTQMNLWVSTYQTGRPYSLLTWNNELTIRPVPDQIYKCEIEVYLTPVAFLLSTDQPILNQWLQYIAYGTAMEILRERQDMAGVAALQEGFDRQEAQVLERQATEEIFTPNIQIFNTTSQAYGGVGGMGYF